MSGVYHSKKVIAISKTPGVRQFLGDAMNSVIAKVQVPCMTYETLVTVYGVGCLTKWRVHGFNCWNVWCMDSMISDDHRRRFPMEKCLIVERIRFSHPLESWLKSSYDSKLPSRLFPKALAVRVTSAQLRFTRYPEDSSLTQGLAGVDMEWFIVSTSEGSQLETAEVAVCGSFASSKACH